MHHALRLTLTTGVAVAGAGLIVVTPVAPPPPNIQNRPIRLTDETALIMGGSGIPIPPASYIDGVNSLYLHCDNACTPQGLYTPEGLYPIIGGPKELTFDQSVAQGTTILNNEITQQLAEHHDVTVLGYSQSATIASQEMADIENGSAGIHPDPSQLSFVLIGDPNNPNGGMLERFDLPVGSNPSIPSLGITFSGATPVTEYPTDIYTLEYDGFADYPKYPINVLSDINALLGILFVHTQYPSLSDLADAQVVPTSAGYEGATHYFMIPTENLPLLDPLRSIPVAGPVLSDLVQPDLKALVNLGYGDPNYGWVNEDANVPTPGNILPSLNDLEKLPGLLVSGTEDGIKGAISDIESYVANPAQMFSLADNPLLNLLQTPYFAAVASQDLSIPAAPGDGLQGIVNAITAAASSVYGSLLPTADIANALVTTLPSEAASIFVEELEQGNFLDAVAYPIGAVIGLVPVAGLFEIAAVGEGVALAGLDLASPFIDVASIFP